MKKLLHLALLALVNTAIAQTIIDENFDVGIPPTWTVLDFGTDSDTWQGTTAGFGGNYLDGTEFALVDSDAAGSGEDLSEQLISPSFDASSYSNGLFIEFDQYFNAYSSGDSAFVDVFDGTAWVTVLGMGSDQGSWAFPDHQLIELTAYLNANMQIRFRYEDNGIWAWFWGVDNVLVYAPIPNDVGVTAILQGNGRLETTSALTANQSITIEVSNYSGVPITNIPVALEVDGALSAYELFTGTIAPSTTMDFQFAATVDLSNLGEYDIRAWTDLGGDGDLSNDTLGKIVIQHPNEPLVLPYCESFEAMADLSQRTDYLGLPGAVKWDFETSVQGLGRLRSEAGLDYPNTGTKAITLDVDPDGSIFAVNYVTATFNLAAYDVNAGANLALSFYYMEHGDEVQSEDLVWLRGSEADPWIVILDWNTGTGGSNGVYFAALEIPIADSLAANGQNFSNSTQLRFGQSDNFPTTDILSSDGFTFDDIKIVERLNEDVGVTAILNPNLSCGNENTSFEVEIANFGQNALGNIPVELMLTGDISGTLSGVFQGPLAAGDTSTFTLGTINTLAGGMVVAHAFTNAGNDQNRSNDSLVFNLEFGRIDQAEPIPTVACNDALAYAVVSQDSSLLFEWYDGPAGNLIGMGDSLFLGPLSADSTVYIQTTSLNSMATQGTVGAIDTTQGTGGGYNVFSDGLVFDVFQKIILDSVFVYTESTGDVVINLLDANGNALNSATVAVTTTGRVLVPLGFTLQAGSSYQLNAAGSTVLDLYRNNDGAAYPYSSDAMEITGTINGLAFYYFFYDWHYSPFSCEGDYLPITVQASNTAINVDYITDVSCYGGSSGATGVSGTGGIGTYSYLWETGTATPILGGLSAGTYSLTVTDMLGCTAIDSISIVEPDSLVTSATFTHLSCFGLSDGNISIDGSGGTPNYEYLWSTGDTTAVISGLSSGTYGLTLTDENACTDTSSYEIFEPTEITATPTSTNISCNGGSDGCILIMPTGGVPPYGYVWSDGQTSDFACDLFAGTYNLTITDASGCTKTIGGLSLTEPTELELFSSISNEISGNTNGAIDLTATGGAGPYQFDWSNGATTEDISGLSAGDYEVTLTDSRGCTLVESYFVDLIEALGNISGLQQFDLSPNPSAGDLSILIVLEKPREIQLSIYSIDGRELLSFTPKMTALSTYRMDLTAYPKGIYLARLLVGEAVVTRKIVLWK